MVLIRRDQLAHPPTLDDLTNNKEDAILELKVLNKDIYLCSDQLDNKKKT